MPDDPIPRIRPTLRAMSEWFAATKTPHVVIGGVAVSLLGRARTTRDVDAVVLIPEDAWESFLASGKDFGFVPRNPDPIEFAIQSRVLLLVHQPEGTPVDVSLGWMPLEQEIVANGRLKQSGDVQVRLPRVEDLIILKAVASRLIDLADIETLLDINPGADVQYIRDTTRQLAEALELPTIIDRLESVLAAKS